LCCNDGLATGCAGRSAIGLKVGFPGCDISGESTVGLSDGAVADPAAGRRMGDAERLCGSASLGFTMGAEIGALTGLGNPKWADVGTAEGTAAAASNGNEGMLLGEKMVLVVGRLLLEASSGSLLGPGACSRTLDDVRGGPIFKLSFGFCAESVGETVGRSPVALYGAIVKETFIRGLCDG
jgi:hypothetical protein